MRILLLVLCLFLSGCAYGQYDRDSGLFWVDQSPLQKQMAGDAARWQQFYQWQQVNQLQQINNSLRMRPSLGY